MGRSHTQALRSSARRPDLGRAARRSNARCIMPNDQASFFEERREWSRRKHEVFAGYAPQFARILGWSRGTVYLVDGFAGPGYYGGGTERELGSPMLAAGIAHDLA